MNLRILAPALAAVVVPVCLVGCSDSNEPIRVTDPAAFTVSYRNAVRLPVDGSKLTADRFAEQLASKDPIRSARCAADDSEAYRSITEFLGGIRWSHPVAIIKDESLPPLYDGRRELPRPGEMIGAGYDRAASDSPAPSIERPDLVGVRNGIAVFLSKLHGLVAIDTTGTDPTPSCAMKLPGDPVNFFVKGDELVLIVNALDGFNRSALLRYSFAGGQFAFIDAVPLPNQTIVDARTFDSTIVLYTNWTEERTPTPIPEPAVGSGSGHGMGGGSATVGSDYAYGGSNSKRLGAKVIVAQWDDALGVDWEDAFLDAPEPRDPTEGLDPKAPLTVGQVVSTSTTWAGFVAASDRYLAIPRRITRSTFQGYGTRTYDVCTKYKVQEVEKCAVTYDRQKNPDYKAPDPSTGDYSCNGQKLADCIASAAPTVSQYVMVPTGQSCSMVPVSECETYETRTETYPLFSTWPTTGLTIYRFENGAFTKFDDSLATLAEQDGALSLETSPLEIDDEVFTRDQIQFQNGKLYVLTDWSLHTMAVVGNSVARVHELDAVGSGRDTAVVFSKDRVMLSARGYDYERERSYSRVTMLDLAEPTSPTLLTSFTMPGETTQLLLANGGILGPGNVSLSNAEVRRTLQKITLFSNTNGTELDNLLVGTEYDAFVSSWFAPKDDQRIRLGDDGTRVFLPYSGRHHAEEYTPTAHRLNISRIDNGRLVPERSFEVSDEIIRTAAVDDTRSVVFGDSASYMVDRSSGDWAISTISEIFVPFATYRLSDTGLIAIAARVGSKCRVSTYANEADVFGDAPLAAADLPCGEGETPRGFASSLLWKSTQTGVTISADGKSISVLSQDDVNATFEKIPTDQYCYVDNGKPPSNNVRTVDYLDDVPSAIYCEFTERR